MRGRILLAVAVLGAWIGGVRADGIWNPNSSGAGLDLTINSSLVTGATAGQLLYSDGTKLQASPVTTDASGDLVIPGTLTVGTVSSATGLFVCETAGLLSSGITTCVASDRAAKHDIITISDDVLAKVMNKRGVRFTYNEGKGAPGRRIGVIANEWEDDFPELIDIDDNGLRHFDYAATWGLTVELFKRQEARIAELERRLH